MKFYKEKIMNMYPDSGKIALFISLLALGLMVGNNNQPCLSAQSTCSVGSDNEFTENIKIKGGTSYATTLDGSGILADRTLTLPDSDLDLNNVIVGGGLSSSKSVSTDGSGDLTTNDVYPLTLTASSVVVTDVSGNLTDGTVDLDQLTPGGASTNDEIRMGAGGDWEAYTPAGGGDYTKIDSGSVLVSTTSADEIVICWNNITLDPTKVYKLVVWGGNGNDGASGYYPYIRLTDGDCSTGARNEWGTGTDVQRNLRAVGRLLDSGSNRNSDTDNCQFLQGNVGNHSAGYTSNIGGDFTIRTGTALSGASSGEGFILGFHAWGNVQQLGVWSGVQDGVGTCSWTNTLDFSDVTGMYGSWEGGFPSPVTDKEWSLYEVASQ
tara:strand:+ start:595 stop:1731 length:1137 start_codon:yes stop_codon:yes gene_type:complete